MSIAKTLLGITLVATLAASAFAAESQGRHHQDPLQRLQSRLNLTNQQVEQLRPTFAAMRQERQTEHTQLRTELQQVLTQEQLAELGANGMQGRRHHGMRDLHLTHEQRDQFKAYWAQNRPAMKAEHEKFKAAVMSVLTPEQQSRFQQMGQRHHHHRSHNENRPEGSAE